jgi:hypothetical protein
VLLVNRAIDALNGDLNDAKNLINAAVITAFQSEHIAHLDKKVVAAAMREHWDDAAKAAGLTPPPIPSGVPVGAPVEADGAATVDGGGGAGTREVASGESLEPLGVPSDEDLKAADFLV